MMSKKKETTKIVDILLNFKGDKIQHYCTQSIKQGTSAYQILQELSDGLETIGEGYENKEYKRYFTSDLIVSGRNMKKAVELLKPHIESKHKAKGIILVGTVKGDVHDIGKMIFSIILESNGFKTIDLGTDVSTEIFIKKVKQVKPDILGMSSLLTSTTSHMEDVIAELSKLGLKKKVKVIVGGRAVTAEYARKIGADAYGKDAIDGLKKCLHIMEEKSIEDLHSA